MGVRAHFLANVASIVNPPGHSRCKTPEEHRMPKEQQAKAEDQAAAKQYAKQRASGSSKEREASMTNGPAAAKKKK